MQSEAITTNQPYLPCWSAHPCRLWLIQSTFAVFFQKFQSTHPCRVRHHKSRPSLYMGIFQSTHPCRIDSRSNTSSKWWSYFNPRTHVESTAKNKKSNTIFQSSLYIFSLFKKNLKSNTKTHYLSLFFSANPPIILCIHIIRTSQNPSSNFLNFSVSLFWNFCSNMFELIFLFIFSN